MTRKRFSEEQIIEALKSNEEGVKVADICLKLGISEQIFYRWRNKYSGMEVAEAKHLREPEAENTKPEELSVESDPDDVRAYNDQGGDKYKSGDYEGAIADFDEAIKSDLDNADIRESRGVLLKMKRKRFSAEQIIKALKSSQAGTKVADICRELDIDEQTFYRWRVRYRGMEVAEVKHMRAAILWYNQAIKLNPDDAEAYYDRGVAKYELKDYAGAIADCDEAIKLKPDSALVYHARGCFKEKLEDYEQALADFNEAIKLDPDNADAQEKREKLLKKISIN